MVVKMNKIIMFFLILVSCVKVFAAPNMSEYIEGDLHQGLFTGYYVSQECKMQYGELNGGKVAIGYEPSSKTMVVVGRALDGFFCHLIDCNGNIEASAIEDWQHGYFRLRFPFYTSCSGPCFDPCSGSFFEGEISKFKTCCEVHRLESEEPHFYLITETLDTSN